MSSSGKVENMVANHQGFCLQTVKAKKLVTEIAVTENFNLGPALENVYPLLNMVFSYLDCDELRTCCQVNSIWRETAEKVLERRVGPSWFTCYRQVTKSMCPYSICNSDNLKYSSISLGIVLMDIRKIRSNKKVCMHIEQNTFSTTSIQEYIERLILKDVQYCMLSCCRVLSSFKQEIHLKDQYVMDGLFLPQIPNIKSTMFYYPRNHNNFGNIVERNKELKCLLIFTSTQNSYQNRKKIIDDLLVKLIPGNKRTSVALGGGVVRGMSVPKSFGRRSSNAVLSIGLWETSNSGADFNAFSHVINGDYLSRDEFTREILKFRGGVILRRHSVAIRICCSAKRNAEEEIVIFSDIFPKVPLLGFYADGEVGWNSSLSTGDASQNDDHNENVHHQWSTVFVLITWGIIS